MLYRCEDPSHASYQRYGARGIAVCKQWHEFETFLRDMGRRPSPKHSIDRIDNDGNYEPANCKWSTVIEQANNSRNNRVLTFRGESKTLAQWAREFNMKWDTLRCRLREGWSMERAVTEPLKVQKKRKVQP